MAEPTKMLVFSAADRPDLCTALTGTASTEVADHDGDPHLLRASKYVQPGKHLVIDLPPTGRRHQH